MAITHDVDREVVEAASEVPQTATPIKRRKFRFATVISVIVLAAILAGLKFTILSVGPGPQAVTVGPAAQAAPAQQPATVVFNSPIPGQENQSESPTQVGHDLSLLLVGAYETPTTYPQLATDYLNNVYACRDASCGYTESVGQLGNTRFLQRAPSGDIVDVNANLGATSGQVSGSMSVQTGRNILTAKFTAQWVASSHEWLATNLFWQAVRS
jgi:hypothetical protein